MSIYALRPKLYAFMAVTGAAFAISAKTHPNINLAQRILYSSAGGFMCVSALYAKEAIYDVPQLLYTNNKTQELIPPTREFLLTKTIPYLVHDCTDDTFNRIRLFRKSLKDTYLNYSEKDINTFCLPLEDLERELKRLLVNSSGIIDFEKLEKSFRTFKSGINRSQNLLKSWEYFMGLCCLGRAIYGEKQNTNSDFIEESLIESRKHFELAKGNRKNLDINAHYFLGFINLALKNFKEANLSFQAGKQGDFTNSKYEFDKWIEYTERLAS
jgi:hypothetical protein